MMWGMALLELGRILTVYLELCWGAWESSRETLWGLGLVSSCNVELRVPLELKQGSRASSRVSLGNSVFLSCCSSGLRVTLEPWWGSMFLSV